MSKQFLKIGEAWSKIDESAKIHGKALIPRISRNNNLYTKKELARFDNVTVPLNWEHNPDKIIGTATFSYNAELETVFYEGEITDPAASTLARNRLLYTSIEANPTSATTVCNGPEDCFSMPKNLQPIALALTETPGIPETSVGLLESFLAEHSSDLEKQYVPDQTNLKNEDHIESILAQMTKESPEMPEDQKLAIAFSRCSMSEGLAYLTKELFKIKETFTCPDCGKLK